MDRSHVKLAITNSNAPRCCLLELCLLFFLLVSVSLPLPSLTTASFSLFPSGLNVYFQEKVKAIGVPRLCAHIALTPGSAFIPVASRGQPLPCALGTVSFQGLLPGIHPTIVFRRKGHCPVFDLLLAGPMQGGLRVNVR